MWPKKIEHDEIKKAIQSGHSYIQVGTRKFLLLEVEEVSKDACYEVNDPEEEKWLMAALNDENPILSESVISKLLEVVQKVR